METFTRKAEEMFDVRTEDGLQKYLEYVGGLIEANLPLVASDVSKETSLLFKVENEFMDGTSSYHGPASVYRKLYFRDFSHEDENGIIREDEYKGWYVGEDSPFDQTPMIGRELPDLAQTGSMLKQPFVAFADIKRSYLEKDYNGLISQVRKTFENIYKEKGLTGRRKAALDHLVENLGDWLNIAEATHFTVRAEISNEPR